MSVFTGLGVTEPRDYRARYAIPGHPTIAARVILPQSTLHTRGQHVRGQVAPVLPWLKPGQAREVSGRETSGVVIEQLSSKAAAHQLLVGPRGQSRIGDGILARLDRGKVGDSFPRR